MEIFQITRNSSFAEISNSVTGRRIADFHREVNSIWPFEADVLTKYPKPSNKLRALYLGDITPKAVTRNLLRLSLYVDEVAIFNPINIPWERTPQYDPIKYPNQYIDDTVKILIFLRMVEPFVSAGMMYFLPSPQAYIPGLLRDIRSEMFEEVARDLLDPESHPEFLQEALDQLIMVHAGEFEDQVTDHLRSFFPALSQVDLQALAKKLFDAYKTDPLSLPPSRMHEHDQLMAMRGGTDIISALSVAQGMGAFPYTTTRGKSAQVSRRLTQLPEDSAEWTRFSADFSQLRFDFLNAVDPKFAISLRGDGRLESFRNFLRDVNRQVRTSTSDSSELTSVVALGDRLTNEYHVALEEWRAIDSEILKWFSQASPSNIFGAATAAYSIASGNVNLLLGALGMPMQGVLSLIQSWRARRSFQFRIPMSVMLELNGYRKL